MEVFQSIKFQTHLCVKSYSKYQLNIGNKKIELTFPQLLHLRLRLFNLTLPKKINNIIENENYILLFVADKKHLLFLEIPQLLDLKDEIDFFFINQCN